MPAAFVAPFPTFAFIDGLGGGEMLLIFFVILMLFGGQRLPDFARTLGKSVRQFKKAASGVEDQIKRALDDPEPTYPPPKKPRYTRPPETIEPSDPAPASNDGDDGDDTTTPPPEKPVS
jgi:sec-independent protein translocase protein TatA